MKSGPNDNLPIIQTNRHTSVNDALKASGVFFEQMKHILANNARADPDNPKEDSMDICFCLGEGVESRANFW